MKTRRIVWIVVIVLLAGAAVTVNAGELRINARAALTTLSLRVGVEYRFGRYLGVQADIGSSINIFTADLCGVVYLLDASSPWQVNLLVGVPNAGVNWLFDEGMVTVGGSVGVSYRFDNDVSLGGLLGAGYPFFFVPGSGWEIRKDTNLPLGVWPDAAVFLSFVPRRR
jgi:hypothetical protein